MVASLVPYFSKEKINPWRQKNRLKYLGFGEILFWTYLSALIPYRVNNLHSPHCLPVSYHTNTENTCVCPVCMHTCIGVHRLTHKYTYSVLTQDSTSNIDIVYIKQRIWYLCSTINENPHTFLFIKYWITWIDFPPGTHW